MGLFIFTLRRYVYWSEGSKIIKGKKLNEEMVSGEVYPQPGPKGEHERVSSSIDFAPP